MNPSRPTGGNPVGGFFVPACQAGLSVAEKQTNINRWKNHREVFHFYPFNILIRGKLCLL
jgi:hypothetical protein